MCVGLGGGISVVGNFRRGNQPFGLLPDIPQLSVFGVGDHFQACDKFSLLPRFLLLRRMERSSLLIAFLAGRLFGAAAVASSRSRFERVGFGPFHAELRGVHFGGWWRDLLRFPLCRTRGSGAALSEFVLCCLRVSVRRFFRLECALRSWAGRGCSAAASRGCHVGKTCCVCPPEFLSAYLVSGVVWCH